MFFKNFFRTILTLTLCITDFIECFNIEDFGAKANDSSFETALLNGKIIIN